MTTFTQEHIGLRDVAHYLATFAACKGMILLLAGRNPESLAEIAKVVESLQYEIPPFLILGIKKHRRKPAVQIPRVHLYCHACGSPYISFEILFITFLAVL